jgi:HAD superfamily hydrolase (TIGR01509 family)
MRKRIIVFDMDGVLFDTLPYAEKVTLESHPGMTSAMYKELHSGNFHEELAKYAHLQRAETREEQKERRLAYAAEKMKSPMFAGMKSLLSELHDHGYTLVLNTNAFEANCLPLLERAGIRPLFDLIAAAELSKSKVEKFRLIGDKYAIPSGEMLFVTDSLGDVREADTAKVSTVAVTWGVHDSAFFDREKHANLVAVVHTVEELRGHLLGIRPQ